MKHAGGRRLWMDASTKKTPMTPEKSDWQVQQELEEKDCLGLFIFMWVVLSLFLFFWGTSGFEAKTQHWKDSQKISCQHLAG